MADDEIRRLERIHGVLQDVESWTALAVASERAGLPWPAPPESFAPGFRFMSEPEVAMGLEQARLTRRQVEVIWRPNREVLINRTYYWPEKNEELGLPQYVKNRFRVGRSTGRQPVYVALANTRSRGGSMIVPADFIYLRLHV